MIDRHDVAISVMCGFHPRDLERLTLGELLRYCKAAQDWASTQGGSGRGR